MPKLKQVVKSPEHLATLEEQDRIERLGRMQARYVITYDKASITDELVASTHVVEGLRDVIQGVIRAWIPSARVLRGTITMITEDAAVAIYERWHAGQQEGMPKVTQAELARQYNVSPNTVWRIVHRRGWRYERLGTGELAREEYERWTHADHTVRRNDAGTIQDVPVLKAG